jgi:hypothetical protein
MNRGFLILTIIISFTSFSNFFAQVKHPWKDGSKILNDKIENYKHIDSLDYYEPINAIKQNKILNFGILSYSEEFVFIYLKTVLSVIYLPYLLLFYVLFKKKSTLTLLTE